MFAIHVVVPAYNPGEIIIDVIEKPRSHADTVVIVDDGCDAENRAHLERCSRHSGISLLTHARNCGKGFALMTGIGHCLDRMRADDYILTMDSDGQHDPEEIAKFRALLTERPNVHFALGQRLDTRTMPVKSRIGSGVATALFRLQMGTSIQDTQTGMRLLSKPFAQRVYDEVRPGRYETEIDMLILAVHSLAKIDSVEIRTIYLDGNSATKFRALSDSWRVLARLMRSRASDAAQSTRAPYDRETRRPVVLSRGRDPSPYPHSTRRAHYSPRRQTDSVDEQQRKTRGRAASCSRSSECWCLSHNNIPCFMHQSGKVTKHRR